MTPSDAIFLVGADGSLERIPLTSYSSETVLQKLIEDHPALLAGEQIDPSDPPRWLLVSREAGIPDGDGSSDRWAADHLLLDQNARPTIVEVKRSSDTRIRREVIGQMLDYAANAAVYWPTDRIRTLAASTYGSPEQLEERVLTLIGVENAEDSATEIENYWRRVDNNLRNGELRLLFVADELPRELRRVIEFLNEHMPRIEVLGIEVRQFVGKNMCAIVPRVIGQTERARQEKVSLPARKISQRQFIESCPEWCQGFFQELFDVANREEFRIEMGTKGFSIRVPGPDGALVSLLWGFPPGSYGREAPSINVILNYVSPFEDPHGISSALNKLAFKRSGGTMTLVLSGSNLELAREALAYLWQLGRKIKSV